MSKHYEQRKEANERYLAKMDEIRIRLPKESGLKDAITAHAKGKGESVQAFIIRAIQFTMKVETEMMETYKERKAIVDVASYLGNIQNPDGISPRDFGKHRNKDKAGE